jgi:competence protein ComEC
VVLNILTFKGGEEDNCVKMLDVGQGDCIYLETKGGLHMLIDGGSSSASEIGKYTILPFLKYNGVRKLDYVIVTHADKDHISGIVEMLEEERAMVPMIEHLILPDIPLALRDDSYLKVEMLAKRKGCEVLYFSKGKGISYKDFSLTCLFPSKDIQTGGKWDKNELSLVCQVELNATKFLFTGDLGELGELWLLEHHLLGSVSALKVGHHGSKNSSSMEFLAKVMPEIALISCGKDNVYGHPGVETLERLREVESEVWNTAECGQIVVDIDETSELVVGKKNDRIIQNRWDSD